MHLEGNFDLAILDYNISHKMCLVRIFNYPTPAKHTDLVFSSTEYIGMPSKMNGKISIDEVPQDSLQANPVKKLLKDDQMKIFRFTAPEGEFYLIAGTITLYETELLPLQSSIR